MAKNTAKLIDKRDHLRDVYDSRRTPENKKKLQAADEEVKKAMAARKKPAATAKKATGKK